MNSINPKDLKYITTYGLNMNISAKDKILIGRNNELRLIMQTLTRREKSSPMLIGMAGTGKTAIVYGLCNLINQNKVPSNLKGYIIYSLNINQIEAGTKFQGEIEERIEGILQEAKKYRDKIILFIDEIHIILGNKLANVIKPYISSGEIKCIGATTLDEYRKFIEPDTALKRRFNLIYIEEPNINETINIVRGIKHQLQEYYTVNIPDKVIQKTAQISKRYFITYNNPDLTIELIDDTASRIKFEREIEPYSIAKIANLILELNLEIESLKIEAEQEGHKIKELQDQIDILQQKYDAMHKQWTQERVNIANYMSVQKKINDTLVQIEEYKLANNFVEAGRLLYLEIPKYKQQLKQIEQAADYKYLSLEMNFLDILHTISKKTGIGIEQLSYNAHSITKLKSFISQHILGQGPAISAICSEFKRVFGGFRNPNKPLLVLCFVGPTGVGKTKVGELISEFLFNNQDCIKIINMAQYQDKHNISGLFGTTAGYVGYKEEGLLTGAVRMRPYQIILLDELEKAHPSIFDTLLAIFDKGIIEDNAGRLTNFREAIIIITLNIYYEQRRVNDDNHHVQSEIMDEMFRIFRPEFISRLDAIIQFNNIGAQYFHQIITNQIQAELAKFEHNAHTTIVLHDNVYAHLTNLHNSTGLGVREISKMLQQNLYNKIIDIVCDMSETARRQKYLYIEDIGGNLTIQTLDKHNNANNKT